MQERRDNASQRLFHDTIQLLQQLLLFATNAILGETSISFTCHGSSKFNSWWLGNITVSLWVKPELTYYIWYIRSLGALCLVWCRSGSQACWIQPFCLWHSVRLTHALIWHASALDGCAHAHTLDGCACASDWVDTSHGQGAILGQDQYSIPPFWPITSALTQNIIL